MAAAVDIRARVGSLTKCSICLENYEQPRCLPCLHTFCLKCLQSLCQGARPGNWKPCPNCRKMFQIPARGVDELPVNFDMVALVEANEQGLGGAEVCDRHPAEALKLYCFDCHADICTLCYTLSHAGHYCEDAVTAAERLRQIVDADVRRLSRRFDELRADVARLNDAQRKYSDEVRKVEAGIRNHGEAVKRFVDDEVKRLVQRVKAVEAESLADIQQRRERLELAVAAMESFKAYSDEIRRRSRVGDMMKASTELREAVDELLQRSVDVSECHPGLVDFIPSDFPQLLRAAGVDQDIVGKLTDCTFATAVVPTFQTARTTIFNAEPPAARPPGGWKLRRKLPPGRPVRGVACLDGDLYVLRLPANHEVEVYNVVDYTLERRVHVPRLREAIDLASCDRRHCLYLADDTRCSVRRVDPRPGPGRVDATEWQTGEKPAGISVTSRDGHVLVTCRDDRRLKLFTADGTLIQQVELEASVTSPCHAVEMLTQPGTFLVCHGSQTDTVGRVCLVNGEGRVVAGYGGVRGRDAGQLDFPRHVVALPPPDGAIVVADFNNARVVLLTATLGFVRELSAEVGGLDLVAYRLCVDSRRRRLYVGGMDQAMSTGRLSVFDL